MWICGSVGPIELVQGSISRTEECPKVCDRVGVIVEIERPGAEEVLSLVVDADRDDGIDEMREYLHASEQKGWADL